MQLRFPNMAIITDLGAIRSEKVALICACVLMLSQAQKDIEKAQEAKLRAQLQGSGGRESKELDGASKQLELAKKEASKIKNIVQENLIKYLKDGKIQHYTIFCSDRDSYITLSEFAIKASLDSLVEYFHQQNELPANVHDHINTIEMAKRFYHYGYDMSRSLRVFAMDMHDPEAVRELVLTCGANINYHYNVLVNTKRKAVNFIEDFCEYTKNQILWPDNINFESWRKPQLEMLDFLISRNACFSYGKPIPQDLLDFLRSSLKSTVVDLNKLPKMSDNNENDEEKVDLIPKKSLSKDVISSFQDQIVELIANAKIEIIKTKMRKRQEEIQAAEANLVSVRRFAADKLLWWVDNDHITIDAIIGCYDFARKEFIMMPFLEFVIFENLHEIARHPKCLIHLSDELMAYIQDMEMLKIFYDAGVDANCPFAINMIFEQNDPVITKELVNTYGFNVNQTLKNKTGLVVSFLDHLISETERKINSDEKLTDEWKKNRQEILVFLVASGARGVSGAPVDIRPICRKLATKRIEERKAEKPIPPKVRFLTAKPMLKLTVMDSTKINAHYRIK